MSGQCNFRVPAGRCNKSYGHDDQHFIPTPPVPEEKRWMLWVCPGCGGIAVRQGELAGHWDGLYGPGCYEQNVATVEVVPASELDALRGEVEDYNAYAVTLNQRIDRLLALCRRRGLDEESIAAVLSSTEGEHG